MGEDVETLKRRLPLLEYLRQQNWKGHQRADPSLLDSVHCMKRPGPRSMSTHAKMSSTVTAAARAAI